ncbi:MAG: family 16 glycosylhydrolase [Fibrella sp.]|nr:family 16 glycosylhydrolase [Armatimonadota bacterium]
MHIKGRIGNTLIALGTVAGTLIAGATQAQTWQPVWNDEFDKSGGTDPSKWRYEVGGSGWGNNESQFYTNNRRANSRIAADKKNPGRLIIEARKEPFQGSKYTSARLISVPSWTYGRMVIRAKLPGGRGTWPAIWMLPIGQSYGTKYWPENGEIDIMEQVGYDPKRVHGSIHTLAYYHSIGTQKTGTVHVTDPMTNWHTYALEWYPHEIRVYIDDVGYFTYTRTQAEWQAWPFDKPFGFRLNLAVGGNWGGAQGIDDSIFPRSMEIDYVRVYKSKSKPYLPAAVSVPGRVQAENYDRGGEGFAFHDTDTGNKGNLYRKDGVDLEASKDTDGTPAVGWLALGEWLNYSVDVKQAGSYALSVRTASLDGGKKFFFEVDDKRATPDLTAPSTKGFNNWKTISGGKINLTAGRHTIRLMSLSDAFNVNYFELKKAAP